ncbi:CubicO group peptidase (beta-lactamase class C family) [Caulobacter ginsengisoli]|uniref:CubicO group peptidase (Beta-lactamase class C family) n=1 Tax=Caulobacter ginsengisoli TaxID=400775 RepID=A0ABU0IK89_9CAUL|nr:serine hydrolase domain-containing protein [Caulobacter ginsengisoli]MDQ0462432.1 CubicO group peptidase (beta-lactamase class C family) [Caulobacter ginsengisoli]
MRNLLIALALLAATPAMAKTPTPAQIDAEVARQMAKTGAQGLAVAVIDGGKVRYVQAYGKRNAKGEPLTRGTVMYGASLTKAVFAYTVMQLVDEKLVDLDASITAYLKKPLPDYTGFGDNYAPYETLAGDERWRRITPRMLLTHSAGFANFYWDNPGEKLVIHFDPGSRYAYSGDGMILMQFVLEQGLGLKLGAEMQRRVFDRFGMANTSMMWRPDFAANLADGWDEDGKPQPHDERSRVRAAGSMDTTIDDMAKFAAGLVRGEGLSRASRAEMLKPSLPITTRSQFLTFQPELPPEKRRPDLAAGLGVVVFKGPQGPGFYKGGHDDITGNTMVCVEKRQACVVLLGNDVRAEKAYPALVAFILGETGAPWDWEYGFTPIARN